MPRKDWNQLYLNKITPWNYNTFSEELERRYQEWNLSPKKYARVLDVGCGTGTTAIEFARRGFEVTACDIAEEAIRQAQEKSRSAKVEVQWLQGDFFKYDWKTPPFPLVVDRGCYHILRQIDVNRYLEVLDHLTHKGSLFIVLAGSTNYPGELGPPKISAEDLCQELGQIFHLKDLREFHFEDALCEGVEISPIGWSAVFEKPESQIFTSKFNANRDQI